MRELSVLYVDDDPDIRALLCEYLGGVGYEVREAADARTMRASMKDHAFDLVLLDQRLPGDDGLKLAAELRTLGRERICQIHCTDTDEVWLQETPRIDLRAVKRTLDDMDWSGWLVVERSRRAQDARNVKGNFGANVTYLKSIFAAA